MSQTTSDPNPSSSPSLNRHTTNSSTATSTSTPTQPLTLDSLLSAHENAPSPPLAALEHVLNERNVLSSQNAQLWKLIEKQRTGYNQLLKELDRVRNERDSCKTKLLSLGLDSKKRNGDREKSLKHSHSTPLSVDHADPSESRTPQSQPRSNDPTLQTSQSTPSLSPSSQSFSTPTSARSQKTAPPPLSVPTRSESLPLATTASPERTSPDKSTISHRLSGDPTLPSTKPLTLTPRKANTSDGSPNPNSFPNGTLPSFSNNHPTPSLTQTPPPQSTQTPHLHSLLTPQTAPPGYGFSDGSTASLSHTQAQTQGTTPPRLLAPNTNGNLLLPSGNLGGGDLLPPQRHILSRESRISLPDEAKQYIANMQDSPTRTTATIPSPLASYNQPSPTQSADVNQGKPQPRAQPVTTSAPTKPSVEFSPRPAKSSSSSNADMIQFLREGPSPPGKSSRVEGAKPKRGQEEFLDFDDDEDDYDDWNVLGGRKDDGRRPKVTMAAVEDFPLPPSNAPGHDLSQAGLQKLSAAATAQQKDNLSLNGPTPISITDETLYIKPGTVDANFRALPLLFSDLPYTQIQVSHSSIKPNERGKDVLSFMVAVEPGQGKDGWKIEKLYSDVLGLDSRVRASVGKGMGKKMASLPEGKLWRDHAPAKVDQRKAALETYLQSLINLPVKNKDEVIAFLTSDIVRETQKPVSQAGYKEGYLTKRGKNFGGWKSRFFVLQGPVLEYYESRGGAHLGSIIITGSQIGRQQSTSERPSTDDEEYRHAFLIVEAKKGPGGNHPRHVLCAESDEDRDSWVEMLVRYVTGAYNDEPIPALGPSPIVTNDHSGPSAPRSSTSSVTAYDNNGPFNNRRPAVRPTRDDISKPPPMQISQAAATVGDHGDSSPVKSIDPSPIDRQAHGGISDAQVARKLLERGQQQQGSGLPPPDGAPLSSSLPTLSPLDNASGTLASMGQRANSELGHYADMGSGGGGGGGSAGTGAGGSGYGRHHHQRDQSPEHHRRRDHHADSKPPGGGPAHAEVRAASPDVNGKAKISGPIGGAPIPAGYKFGGKDPGPDASSAASANERREKAKSRSFWGFGRPNGGSSEKAAQPAVPPNRAVFGVPLEESLDVVQIATLPAVVFRCIQYLEAKKADQEEGIYRLSGSSAVIKSLKDRFNLEGDVNLLVSDEYWDPHAIAGLLKTFLRELPASILTRDLHLKFLSVIDFVDPQERIKELSQLIAALPIANYSLLRALTAHLILIVQNAGVNKMTMRNVGIVFSPTLGIPAGVFSLMLGEFNRVFNVDSDTAPAISEGTGTNHPPDLIRRNSRQYTDAAADQLLGLSGRSLDAPVEEVPSDGDDYSVHDESGTETTEGDTTLESSGRSSPSGGRQLQHIVVTSPDTPTGPKSSSGKASYVAATRGLNINVSERGNRHSRILGLPTSPRPTATQSSPQGPSSPIHTAR